MRIIKITAAIIVAAFVISGLFGCGEKRSDYMTNNCTKDTVTELLAESPELKDKGFTDKSCYNITPDGFNGIKLYKSSENAHTVVKHPGYTYAEIDMSDAPGLVSAVLCDLENNGLYDDVLYTYSNGTTKEYGIGVYNGVFGYSTSVFKSYGEMYLYLVKQKAQDGMPDVFSVLTVTVTEFKNNPADLGCIATGSAGVVTVTDGVPTFNPDSQSNVTISKMKYDGINRIIVSTVDKTKTYNEAPDISRITDFLKGIETENTGDKPSSENKNYIIAVVYEDGSVSYAYLNDGGFFKLHGEEWKKIKGSYQLPF